MVHFIAPLQPSASVDLHGLEPKKKLETDRKMGHSGSNLSIDEVDHGRNGESSAPPCQKQASLRNLHFCVGFALVGADVHVNKPLQRAVIRQTPTACC